MNNSAQTETIKYPAPFVAEVHFKEGSKWFDKYQKYFFRSDKISPNTINSPYLNYLETEKFVEREINKTIVSAVIWNNTGVGKKKVYERTSNTILLPRQISTEWFTPTFNKNIEWITENGEIKIYALGFGQWQNEQFEIEQDERNDDNLRAKKLFAAYKFLQSKNLLT